MDVSSRLWRHAARQLGVSGGVRLSSIGHGPWGPRGAPCPHGGPRIVWPMGRGLESGRIRQLESGARGTWPRRMGRGFRESAAQHPHGGSGPNHGSRRACRGTGQGHPGAFVGAEGPAVSSSVAPQEHGTRVAGAQGASLLRTPCRGPLGRPADDGHPLRLGRWRGGQGPGCLSLAAVPTTQC